MREKEREREREREREKERNFVVFMCVGGGARRKNGCAYIYYIVGVCQKMKINIIYIYMYI